MKNIKEKSEEYVSNFHLSQRMCKESFEGGAKYAIGCIIESIRVCDNDRHTDLYKALWNCIEQRKK